MIPNKESQNVEFKQGWHDDYLKHLCAFANGRGGKLYLGISDDGTVVGVNNAKKLLEDIPNKVIQRLGITVDVELKDYNRKDLIEIIVNPVSVPISYHGKYYIRSGSTVQELSGHELRRFILQKDNISWDEITIPDAKIDDLDEPLIMRFLSKAVDTKRLSGAAIKEDISLLLNRACQKTLYNRFSTIYLPRPKGSKSLKIIAPFRDGVNNDFQH